ncbi:MAG TPA: cation transporter [Burkholderiaceae bacterium]|nr:cation transporter [Burkholderiaceae bacterium]
MACTSCHTDTSEQHNAPDPRWRRALSIALVVNATMFLVELWSGLQADSVSLLADAVDFAGDAANYALSLAVLGMALSWRSRAALIKGVCMFGYGVFVLLKAGWTWHVGAVPEALTMGVVGFIALLANTGVAVLLYSFRSGDANMRSVWLCSRNDALSNLAVMLAALGVFGTGSAWPDLAVAAVMATLALSAGWQVVRQARAELAGKPEAPDHNHSHGHVH